MAVGGGQSVTSLLGDETARDRRLASSEVTLSDLTVQYGDFVAVDNLSLRIEPGELFVLLGRSGCGKTSTMRSIAGLEEPSAGSIRVGDQVFFDSKTHTNVRINRRDVGLVFQSYAIWPHMTVYQNVAFPLRMKRIAKPEIKERVRRVLESVDMAHLEKNPASQLSGGQMQRVALARNLVMRPRVLLLDEPLSNLDAKLRESLRTELRQIQRESGITSVYVTHDQAEALVLADRIAVMESGQIQQIGAPEELYRAPATRMIADFLGVTNIFDGVVTVVDQDTVHVRLEQAGTEFLARRPANAVKVGDPVPASVRPEALQVQPEPQSAGSAAPAVNIWSGTVRSGMFAGTHYRLSVDLPGGLIADVIYYGPGSGISEGAQLTLRATPADVQVLTS
jgi:iron(III) transport system ATP-binding protein